MSAWPAPWRVTVHDDVETLSRAAAEEIARAAETAVAAGRPFTLALSGGSTPRTLYRMLATDFAERVPWRSTVIFFGDERCVPPDHPDSNYGMARAALLGQVPALDAQVHRIEGERPPADAAARYDALLRSAFPGEPPATFDVLLLGVGTDGHTASLFPGSATLEERRRWVVPAEAPPGAATHDRVTLTFPALDAATTTIVLCAGSDKRAVVGEIMTAGRAAGARYPVARVTARDRVLWMLDRAAAPPADRDSAPDGPP